MAIKMHKGRDIETLKMWLGRHNVNKEDQISQFQNLFYKMDVKMKSLHQSGFYIRSFHVDDILIYDDYVEYCDVAPLYYEDKESIIHKNIFYLTCLAIGIYDECLDYIRPNNVVAIKENFSSFSTFLPSDVVPYYKGVVERDASVYLSDFVKAKMERERRKQEGLLDSVHSSSGKDNSRGSYSKSTLTGKLFGVDDSSNNISAFIQVVLFPIIILFLSIVIPIMIILAT